jgi:CRISPR/Cas system-associated exonuclease Cas4 (RecB family)
MDIGVDNMNIDFEGDFNTGSTPPMSFEETVRHYCATAPDVIVKVLTNLRNETQIKKGEHMEKMSINAALSMKASLQSRLSELKGMKSEASHRTIMDYGENKKEITEPTYDIKIIDKKCAELTSALFLLDKGIKQANATTKFDVEVNYVELMKPIE